MHEEDERPPNDKSHAYHFSITYNGCYFCLLTPSAIIALPKCLFKGIYFVIYGIISEFTDKGQCQYLTN